jgi:hypothetical protein
VFVVFGVTVVGMATSPLKRLNPSLLDLFRFTRGRAMAAPAQTSRFIPAAALAKNALMPAHLPFIASAIRIIGPAFRAA